MDRHLSQIHDILTHPRHTKWMAPCLVAGEAALGALIIWKIPYTEIDWTAYMQQVRLFLAGERDYTLIKGDTGPLVYPAIHLYIYTGLYHITDGGKDILLAQSIFLGLYMVTLAVVLACYRRINAPPWLLIPLALSKRLHSIFLLRLFNDAWAVLGLWVAIYCFQRRYWSAGALAWSCGLGVKMTLLLAAPAVGMTLLQGAGLGEATMIGVVATQVQVSAALPFIMEHKGKEYLARAFEFSRQFLFKWTVNWRFIGEEIFLSQGFALSLLVTHVSILLAFLETRWAKPSSPGILDFVKKTWRGRSRDEEERISDRISPLFVMDAMLGSMAVGMLCARSLHYQFFAYLAWATPYLLWRSGWGPIWVLVNWVLQEIAWLTYPSTSLSSSIVVVELAMAALSIWVGSGQPIPNPAARLAKKVQ